MKTLRDDIAISILPELLKHAFKEKTTDDKFDKIIPACRVAYRIADEMIKQRKLVQ